MRNFDRNVYVSFPQYTHEQRIGETFCFVLNDPREKKSMSIYIKKIKLYNYI